MRSSLRRVQAKHDRVGPARLDDAAKPLLLVVARLTHDDHQVEAPLGEPRLQADQERDEERLAVLLVARMRLQHEGDGMGGALAQAPARLVRRIVQLASRRRARAPRVSALTSARPFKARETVPIDTFRCRASSRMFDTVDGSPFAKRASIGRGRRPSDHGADWSAGIDNLR